MNKITVLIPVYNEKDSLLELLKKVESVDFGLEKEIILVDDFSTDGTKELYSGINHKILYHEKNLGKGAALRIGLKEATGDIVIIQDADLEYNPDDYLPLVQLIKEDKADVVYGSRFLDKSNLKNFLFLSLVANKTLTVLTNILFGAKLTDMETCYKAFKREFIQNINIKSNRFDFEPEITSKVLKQKVRFMELPITYNARAFAEGKKIGWKDGVQAIWTLIKFRFVD